MRTPDVPCVQYSPFSSIDGPESRSADDKRAFLFRFCGWILHARRLRLVERRLRRVVVWFPVAVVLVLCGMCEARNWKDRAFPHHHPIQISKGELRDSRIGAGNTNAIWSWAAKMS